MRDNSRYMIPGARAERPCARSTPRLPPSGSLQRRAARAGAGTRRTQPLQACKGSMHASGSAALCVEGTSVAARAAAAAGWPTRVAASARAQAASGAAGPQQPACATRACPTRVLSDFSGTFADDLAAVEDAQQQAISAAPGALRPAPSKLGHLLWPAPKVPLPCSAGLRRTQAARHASMPCVLNRLLHPLDLLSQGPPLLAALGALEVLLGSLARPARYFADFHPDARQAASAAALVEVVRFAAAQTYTHPRTVAGRRPLLASRRVSRRRRRAPQMQSARAQSLHLQLLR